MLFRVHTNCMDFGKTILKSPVVVFLTYCGLCYAPYKPSKQITHENGHIGVKLSLCHPLPILNEAVAWSNVTSVALR